MSVLRDSRGRGAGSGAAAPAWRRPASALLVLAAGLLAVATAGAGPAAAHAGELRSSPANGATLATAPAAVTLTFDENVRTPAHVIVTGPDGKRVDTGDPTILDATVTEKVAPLEVNGRYTFAYRIVSADGHAVGGEGSFTFTGGSRSAPASAAAAAPAEQDDGHAHHYVVAANFAAIIAIALVVLVASRRRSGAPKAEDS